MDKFGREKVLDLCHRSTVSTARMLKTNLLSSELPFLVVCNGQHIFSKLFAEKYSAIPM